MKLNGIEKWFIVVGVICVALAVMGFSTLVTQHFNAETNVYYWSFDMASYVKGINTNLTNVNNVFDSADLNLVAHTKWDYAWTSDPTTWGTALSGYFISLVNIIIWGVQILIIMPFKIGSVLLAVGTGILGISLEGSSWSWLYDLINGVANLSLQFLPLPS